MNFLRLGGFAGGASIAYWLGVGLDYAVAAGLIALGIYVALYWQNRFARIVGMMLMGAGIGWGCFAYGKTIGGAHCYAEWRAANVKADQEAKARDIAVAKLARDMAEQQTQELSKQNFDLQKQVSEYADYVSKNTKDRCRLATPDDVIRLCRIGGAGSKDCKGAK